MRDDHRRKRLNLSFSMDSSLQRKAWEILRAVPSGQRTEAVCRADCQAQEQETFLKTIRAEIREELCGMECSSKTEKAEQPQAGDVDDNVLGFLLALQNDGGE